MNRLLLICLLLAPFFLSAQEQVFTWQPLRHAGAEALSAELERWEVFSVDAGQMAAIARENPEGLDLKWILDGRSVSFRLFADDIRSKDYRLIESGQDGERRLPTGPNVTYGGRVSTGGNMRLTLDTDFVFGYWEQDGQTWFVQPLRDFIPGEAPDRFVVYETSAVIPVPDARCGWTKTMDAKVNMETDHGHAKMAGQCYETEIAIASDFLMFQLLGSVAAVQNFALGVLNNVQTNYDNEFADEIRFIVVANFVSSCAACDPWTSATFANNLLVSFRDWGNSGGFGVSYDVASLWTNRDFDGNTVGLAWIGALCLSNRYNILQRYSSSANNLRNLQAHELGHNFASDHDPSGSFTIMAPSVTGSNTWSSYSVNVINSLVSSLASGGACFSNCGGSQPVTPAVSIQMPVTHVCPGSVIPFIDASTGNPDTWVWSFPGGTPGFSTEQHPSVRYDLPGIFPVELSVGNSAGSDTQYASQNITVDDNGTKYLLYETFENDLLFWDVVNPDNSNTWQAAQVGGSPYGKKAAYINSFGYNGSGQVDGLVSPLFSLQGASNPMLKIDYAYRRRNSSGSEQLRIKLSTNGGQSFPHTLFTGQENGSGNFATGGLINGAFTPASASDWCYTGNPGSAACLEISLAAYTAHDNVRILIESVNAGNNNLYVDNVRVEAGCVPPAPPEAAFAAQPQTGCAPLTVSFQDNSIGQVDYRLWNFPGGNPAASDAAFPVVIYSVPGLYNVALEVFNGAGSTLLVEPNFVEVKGPPTANFSFAVNGSTVQFTNLTQGQGILSWNFGDGQSSFDTDPVHTYAQPGQYTVRLTASNECGETVKELVVTIVAPVAAGFSATPTTGCTPLTVQFTNASTGNPQSYAWSFPGGNPANSTQANPVVTYSAPGSFNVGLIAIAGNQADTLFLPGYVNVGEPPQAGFTFSYSPGDLSATFASTTTGADSLRWHAAGQTSHDTTPAFSFPEDGVYAVQLIAFNACGSDTTEQAITIVTLPQAGFGFDAGAGCAPAEVQFTSASSANTISHQWTFEGGAPGSSTLPDPAVTYAQPGAYSVTLIAGNAAGFDTLVQTVSIGQGPVADFDYAYAPGDLSAVFTNTSTGADSIRWFAAGETSTEPDPVFDFPEDGVYAVRLVAYNACGSDTTEQTITIATLPQAGFGFDAGAGCAPAEVQFTSASSANTISHQWTFEGGAPGSSTLPDPAVTYAQPGAYSVTLIAGNAAGFDTLVQTVSIGQGPVADFDYAYAPGDLSAVFTNTSTGADSIRWFAAGETSTEPDPVFDFPEDGVYAVLLVAYNGCGADTIEQVITIVTLPQAGFSFDAGAGCAPAEVQFTSTSSANTISHQWTFEGGAPGSSTLPDPAVTYAQPGTYSVTLIAGNAAGFDTLAQTLSIGQGPVADFDYAYAPGDLSAAFTNTSTGADSVRWFAAGETSTEPDPVFDFPEDGVYAVRLVAYNACGSDTTEQTITIVTLPQAGFSFDAGAGCAPAEVQFTSTSSANTISHQWTFEGGAPGSSTLPDPAVTYAQPGTYSVTLIAGNAAGFDTLVQTVTIGQGPVADFDFAVNGANVAFQSTSSGAGAYSWDFGDGSGSNEQNPSHTYAADGQYTVTLTASNACGSATATYTVTISSALPTVNFNAGQREGCAPFEVQFINESSGNSESFLWLFPGGSPESSTSENPVVTYTAPGSYNVTLTASNANGGASMTLMDYIEVIPPPAAIFGYSVNERTVSFGNTSTHSQSFIWHFGDGESSAEANPVHEYTGVGAYEAALIAAGPCGVDTLIKTVTISGQAPGAFFTVNPEAGCAPLTVAFSDQSSGNVTFRQWSFPGGSPESSAVSNPEVTYASPGVYDITLIAGNAFGADTLALPGFVEVLDLPALGFSFSIDAGVVSFQPVSPPVPGYTFRWDFGDGATSEAYAPGHSYTANGAFTVTLEVTNVCGTAVSTEEVNVIVNATQEQGAGGVFRLYPNPASLMVTLEAERTRPGAMEFALRDALGRRVLHMALPEGGGALRHEIAIGHLPGGVYYYEATRGADMVVRGKLVVVR